MQLSQKWNKNNVNSLMSSCFKENHLGMSVGENEFFSFLLVCKDFIFISFRFVYSN